MVSTKEIIDSLEFFKDFSEETKEHFAEISEIRRFRNGETIIEEGSFNAAPHILIEGTVDIFKNGNLVETVSEKGAMIGEISFVSKEHKSCAKATPNGEVSLLSFNPKYLNEILGTNAPTIILSCLMKFARNNINKIDETNSRIAKLVQRKNELKR